MFNFRSFMAGLGFAIGIIFLGNLIIHARIHSKYKNLKKMGFSEIEAVCIVDSNYVLKNLCKDVGNNNENK